jgi:hypothetical protein
LAAKPENGSSHHAEGIVSDLPRLTKPFRQAELAATVSGLPL